jgi:hypothetical protein
MNNHENISEYDINLELDTKWIDDFDKLDNEYKSYYKEDLTFIKIHSIYVNLNNEIEKLIEEKIILKKPGTILKNELLGLIKKNMYSNNIKYKLLSILKFNIDIEPYYLKQFLKYTINNSKNSIHKKGDLLNVGNQFLHINKNIDDIYFEKSISMFHDINDLIFIYYYDSTIRTNNSNSNNINSLKNESNINNSNTNIINNINNNNNITKKVFIRSFVNKKTRRKYT